MTTGAASQSITKPPSPALGVVMVVMTLVGWSSVPLFITYLSSSIDTWTQNGWRYAFAALFWAPVLIHARLRRTTPRGLWRACVTPSIFNALGQALFTWAYYNIDASTATFGLRMQIVFLAVGAYALFPSERALLRTPRAWIGIALVLGGVLGTVYLHAPDPTLMHAVGGTGNPTLGAAAAIASGLLFACYALAVRRHMHGFNPVIAFAGVSQLTALVSVAIMLALARDPLTNQLDLGWSVWRLDAGRLGVMALSALIGIALGHVFYFISIARLGVAVSSGVLQLQPFCVAVFRLVISGIAMTSAQWISGSIAVGGAMLLLHTQWMLSRAAVPGKVEQERVPGNEPVGVEAAELDAMPVDASRAIHHREHRERP